MLVESANKSGFSVYDFGSPARWDTRAAGVLAMMVLICRAIAMMVTCCDDDDDDDIL
jgi:hypothetical protein